MLRWRRVPTSPSVARLSALGGCLVVDDEAKVGEGKTTVIYRQSRSRSGTTEKLLSAAQELNAEPNPLCERSALAAGGLRVQLA